jgi:hypothetical protein
MAKSSPIGDEANDNPFVFRALLLAFPLPFNRLDTLEELKSMPKPIVAIEGWSAVQNVGPQSFEELRPGSRLMGYVYGHASLPNTTLVYTSPIVSVDLNQGVVETLNTAYRLGEASVEYRSWEHKRRWSDAA